MTKLFGLDVGCTTEDLQAQGCKIQDSFQNSLHFFLRWVFFFVKIMIACTCYRCMQGSCNGCSGECGPPCSRTYGSVAAQGDSQTHPELQSLPLPTVLTPWQKQLPVPHPFTTVPRVPTLAVGRLSLGLWVSPVGTVAHFPLAMLKIHLIAQRFTPPLWIDLIAIWGLLIWCVTFAYRYRNEKLNELLHLIWEIISLTPLLTFSFSLVRWLSIKQFSVGTKKV